MRLHINERSQKISGSILISVEVKINAAFVQESRTMEDTNEEKEKKNRQFAVFLQPGMYPHQMCSHRTLKSGVWCTFDAVVAA